MCAIIVQRVNRQDQRKPGVPKRDEKPIQGLVSDKNFIVANAVENILAGKWSFSAQTDNTVRLNRAFYIICLLTLNLLLLAPKLPSNANKDYLKKKAYGNMAKFLST